MGPAHDEQKKKSGGENLLLFKILASVQPRVGKPALLRAKKMGIFYVEGVHMYVCRASRKLAMRELWTGEPTNTQTK